MRHVTHVHESRHSQEWGTAHTGVSHVTHRSESRHTQEWVTLHTGMNHVTHRNESLITQEWVTARTGMSHGTNGNESRHTLSWPRWTESHCMSHVTLENIWTSEGNIDSMYTPNGWNGSIVYIYISSIYVSVLPTARKEVCTLVGIYKYILPTAGTEVLTLVGVMASHVSYNIYMCEITHFHVWPATFIFICIIPTSQVGISRDGDIDLYNCICTIAYIYTYIRTYTYMYVCIYVYIYVVIYIYICIYIHMYIFVYVCIYMCVYTHKYIYLEI